MLRGSPRDWFDSLPNVREVLDRCSQSRSFHSSLPRHDMRYTSGDFYHRGRSPKTYIMLKGLNRDDWRKCFLNHLNSERILRLREWVVGEERRVGRGGSLFRARVGYMKDWTRMNHLPLHPVTELLLQSGFCLELCFAVACYSTQEMTRVTDGMTLKVDVLKGKLEISLSYSGSHDLDSLASRSEIWYL